MRLIDADKVNVVEYAGLVRIPPDDYLGLCAFFKKQLIDEQPTINPEDCRAQGRWRKTCVPDIYQCEHCKKATKMDELCDSEILRAYCPNCGAKMDGKEDDI